MNQVRNKAIIIDLKYFKGEGLNILGKNLSHDSMTIRRLNNFQQISQILDVGTAMPEQSKDLVTVEPSPQLGVVSLVRNGPRIPLIATLTP